LAAALEAALAEALVMGTGVLERTFASPAALTGASSQHAAAPSSPQQVEARRPQASTH
jgi:hypothetical protein